MSTLNKKSTSKKKALVLTGDGINCEVETAEACRAAGFSAEIVHLAELSRNPGLAREILDRTSLLVLPGGFSFGDELGSGRVLALRIRRELGWNLPAFARDGGVVIGICNGFQVLVSLGVFGDGVALAHNREGRFINQWVSLSTEKSRQGYTAGSTAAESARDSFTYPTPLLDGIDEIDLPIRHGEGRLLFARNPDGGTALGVDAIPALRYRDENPNGSFEAIAGLTDSSRRIFGLMPHPEAYRRRSQHPAFYRNPDVGAMEAGAGLRIFENAFRIAREVP